MRRRPAPLAPRASVMPLALLVLLTAATPVDAGAAAGAAPAAAAAPVASVQEGEDLLENWQLEDAKAAAESFLAEDPENPAVLLLAARVQHARGEHLAALSLAQAAKTGGVEAADIILPLIESSARYASLFQSIETPHFSIRYIDKDEIVATYAAPVLEAAYQGIGKALGFLPAERGEKIVVEVYPDARGLAGATGLTVKEIETSGTIAVCKFHRIMITSPLATADGYGWADTVAHEFAHLVISKKSHNTIPIWLHEGIAKYIESAWRGKPGDALSPYSEKLLADATRKGEFITYEQMHPSMAKLPSQDAAALAFAEVFTTIEYIVKEYGDNALPRLLELAASGLDINVALKRVTGKSLNELESAWKKYLQRRPFREVAGAKPAAIHLATSEKQAQEARPLEEMKDREVHDFARLGELLQLRGHTQAAVVEYEKAYARAGLAYSTLVYRLARAYADLKRDNEALALLDKALAAHPDDNDCHVLAGRIRLARGDLAGAQRDFETVRLVNPYNPEIHEALRGLYDAKGDHATAERERHFFELSRRLRARHTYELPTPRPGNAHLNLAVVPFQMVELDGQKLAAPAWDIPVEAGKHTIVAVNRAGARSEQTVEVATGATRTVVMP